MTELKSYEWEEDWEKYFKKHRSVIRSPWSQDLFDIAWALVLIVAFSSLSFFCGVFFQQNKAVEAGAAEWINRNGEVEFRFIKK